MRRESSRADQAVRSGEVVQVEVQRCLQQLEEERARGRQLEERCQQLQGQAGREISQSLVTFL